MSEKHKLAWHRVINSKGELPRLNPNMFREQKDILEKEKVVVSEDGKVDLKKYLWDGN